MTSLSPLAEAFGAVLRDRRGEMLVMAPSESRTLTAQDIDTQARDLSAALAALRLSQGHLVVTNVGNASVMPALVLACLRDGLTLMPVDRSTPPAELVALASRWDAAAVVVPESLDLGPALSVDLKCPPGLGRRRSTAHERCPARACRDTACGSGMALPRGWRRHCPHRDATLPRPCSGSRPAAPANPA